MSGVPLVMTGMPLPVELRRNPRARRLTLRLDSGGEKLVVVAPRRVTEADIRQFVARHADWARTRLAHLPPRRPFVADAVIPVLGIDRVIRHDPAWRGGARLEGDAIRAGGDPAFLARRVRTLLQEEARRRIVPEARRHAAALGATVAAVTLRDTSSRWGSCTAGGRLSFSWRLVLAPLPVFDYVIAHEAAHLREMNHGPRFWRLVQAMVPDMEVQRAWLKQHGAELLRYG
jgi:predicted metal-dependent hydrolase